MSTDVRSVLGKHEKSKQSGQCLFVDHSGSRCSGRSINSHTLQKSDSIKQIVENGHVLSLGVNRGFGKTPPELTFKRIGRSKASVFPGFCARHDAQTFLEVENGLPISSKRQAALIGYRVICLEYFKKEANVRLFTDSKVRSAAKSNGRLEEFDAFLFGTRAGLADVKRSKSQYERALHENSFEQYDAIVFELSSSLPFCFASPFAPEFTFNGELILPSPDSKWDTVSVFAGRLGGKDIFMIGGFKSPHHNIEAFVTSAEQIPEKILGGVALNLALEYAENTFFRESWVNSLNDLARYQIISQFLHGTPGEPNARKEQLLSLPDRINIGYRERTIL